MTKPTVSKHWRRGGGWVRRNRQSWYVPESQQKPTHSVQYAYAAVYIYVM